jgi:hypothetical protein
MKMESSLDGYTYEYWFNDAWSGECSLFPGCTCRAVDCDKYVPGDYAGGNHCLIFPLKVGSQVSQHGGDLNFGLSKIIAFHSTISLGEQYFENTYQFHQDFSVQHNFMESDYWLCKNVGFVRKTISAINEDWHLIDYHTIPFI